MAMVYDAPSLIFRMSLLSACSEGNYGAVDPSQPSMKPLVWNATLKMAAIFVVSTVVLGGTL